MTVWQWESLSGVGREIPYNNLGMYSKMGSTFVYEGNRQIIEKLQIEHYMLCSANNLICNLSHLWQSLMIIIKL